MIPHWAKDIKVGLANINAKAEGMENRLAFRDALKRRCIVPVDNFYGWKKTASGKQPYAVALADGGLTAMAGLMGELALTGGRLGAQLHDHYYQPKRSMRGIAQPDAGGTGPDVSVRGDDLLAGHFSRRQRQEQ